MGRQQLLKSKLGERFNALRGSSSRPDFCLQIEVSVGTYGNWERGDRVPDANKLKMIREKTGVNLNWLLTGEGSMIDDAIRVDSRGDTSMDDKSEPGPPEAWDHDAFKEALKQANAYEEKLVDGFLLPEDKFELVASLYREIIVKKK